MLLLLVSALFSTGLLVVAGLLTGQLCQLICESARRFVHVLGEVLELDVGSRRNPRIIPVIGNCVGVFVGFGIRLLGTIRNGIGLYYVAVSAFLQLYFHFFVFANEINPLHYLLVVQVYIVNFQPFVAHSVGIEFLVVRQCIGIRFGRHFRPINHLFPIVSNLLNSSAIAAYKQSIAFSKQFGYKRVEYVVGSIGERSVDVSTGFHFLSDDKVVFLSVIASPFCHYAHCALIAHIVNQSCGQRGEGE